MSDYKRFVAYLYEYHEQQKGENRGFVRVEVRNGTCQMVFQIKVFSLPEGSALNVYGFVRIKNFLYGIPVGILRAARNGITGRLMTPSVHMGDSTFSLNELGGLILFGAEKRIFATQWDDIAIRPNQFTTDAAVLQKPQLTAADTHASPYRPLPFPRQQRRTLLAGSTPHRPAKIPILLCKFRPLKTQILLRRQHPQEKACLSAGKTF